MRIRSAFLSFSLLSSVFVLGACGYTVESSNQDVTFLTPGAEGAKCVVEIDKRKYQVNPPEEINIKKSSKDMEVICYGTNNRTVEMTVPAKFESRAIWGTPAGMAWDYASQSMHYYPDVIAVDFSQEDMIANEQPSYNHDAMMTPEEHDLEEFSPSEPRLNSDKGDVDSVLMRKGDGAEDVVIEIQEAEDMEYEKSDLDSVIEDLRQTPTEDLLQQEASAGDAENAPVDLFPGQ
ncbi:MAG: hypothetical protein ACTHOO_10920 [Alcanivorax sp.]